MQAITNTWFVRLFRRLVLTCLAVAGMSALAWGQCSDGTCQLYIDGQVATFKYSIFGKKVDNIGDAKFFKNNSEFDFSGKGIDAVLTVRLEQLNKKITDIRSVKVKPSEIRITGNDFKLVDGSGVLNEGDDSRIDIQFQLLRSAEGNSRGQIRIPVEFRRADSKTYYSTERIVIHVSYTGLKLDAPPPAQPTKDEEDTLWENKKRNYESRKNAGIDRTRWDEPIVEYLKQSSSGRYKAEAWSILRDFCAHKLNTNRPEDKLERAIKAFDGSRSNRCDCSNEQELGQNYIQQAEEHLAKLSGEKPAKEETVDGAETKAAASATGPDCNQALRIASASGSSCKDLLKVVQSDAYKTCATAVKTARDRYNSILKNDQRLLKQLTEDLSRAKAEAEKLHAYQDYLNGVGRKGTCNREKRQEAEAKVRAISAAIGAFAVHAKDEGSGELSVEIVNAGVDQIDDLNITIQKDGEELEEGRDIYEKADVEKDGDKITFRLKDLDQGKYTVSVYNNAKGLSGEAAVVIYEGAKPGVKLLETDSTNIRFIVNGGVPPYHLYFRKKGETAWLESNSFDLTKAENPHQRIFEVGYSRLASLDAEKGDDIELYIQDKGSLLGEDKAISFVFGERNTSSWLEKNQTVIIIAVILTLVLAIIGLLFLFVVKPWIKKNKTNQLALTLASFLGIDLKETKEEKEERLRKEKGAPREAGGGVAAAALGAGAPEGKVDNRIKINLKKGKEVAVGEPRRRVKVAGPAIKYPVDLEALKDDRNFYHVDLFELWGDSAVKDIYIGKVCAAGISMIVQKELDERELIGEADSEIGGFILGRYGQHADGAYYISFDQFVSAKGERGEDDPYEVELDMAALDDPLRKAPDLTLIGWFHTHPGHSLFLSGKDIDVQKRVFKAPYQVAMEIDPYTKNFDMGFFTWQKDNRRLNESAKDRLAGVDSWPSWSEVNSWRRFLKMGR